MIYCNYCGSSYYEKKCPGCEDIFSVCMCDAGQKYCDECHCENCGEDLENCFCEKDES